MLIKWEEKESIILNLMNKPVVTINEAMQILGLSQSTIKRRLKSGELKQIHRKNLRHKVFIYTDSIKNYLRGEDK